MKYLITVLPLICMAVQSNGMHADPVEWINDERWVKTYNADGTLLQETYYRWNAEE